MPFFLHAMHATCPRQIHVMRMRCDVTHCWNLRHREQCCASDRARGWVFGWRIWKGAQV